MRRQGQRGIDRMKIFASSSASAKMLEHTLDHRTRTGLRCEQTKPASTGGWGKLNFHLAALETSSSQRYWHKLYTVGQRGLNRAMDVLITCYGFTISSGLAVLRSKQSQISICSQLSSRVGTFYQNLASENGKKKNHTAEFTRGQKVALYAVSVNGSLCFSTGNKNGSASLGQVTELSNEGAPFSEMLTYIRITLYNIRTSRQYELPPRGGRGFDPTAWQNPE